MAKKILVLTCFLFVIALFAEGQSFYNYGRNRTLAVSGGIGNATYFGDLVDPGLHLDAKFNITGGLQYFYRERFSVRADLTWFQLQGDDAKSEDPELVDRNLSFRSGNLELAFTGSVSLFETPLRTYQRPKWNPYVFGGIAVLYTNPTAEYNGVRYALQPLKTEGDNNAYSRFQVVLPFGAGVRFRVANFMNINVEGGYRKTFTDYLDDVSTIHQNKADWTDPVRIALSDRRPEQGISPAEPGDIRGNSANKDSYFLLNVKVEYYLKNNFFERTGQRKLYNTKRKSYYRKPGSRLRRR